MPNDHDPQKVARALVADHLSEVLSYRNPAIGEAIEAVASAFRRRDGGPDDPDMECYAAVAQRLPDDESRMKLTQYDNLKTTEITIGEEAGLLVGLMIGRATGSVR
jgi:hypothetical protein